VAPSPHFNNNQSIRFFTTSTSKGEVNHDQEEEEIRHNSHPDKSTSPPPPPPTLQMSKEWIPPPFLQLIEEAMETLSDDDILRRVEQALAMEEALEEASFLARTKNYSEAKRRTNYSRNHKTSRAAATSNINNNNDARGITTATVSNTLTRTLIDHLKEQLLLIPLISLQPLLILLKRSFDQALQYDDLQTQSLFSTWGGTTQRDRTADSSFAVHISCVCKRFHIKYAVGTNIPSSHHRSHMSQSGILPPDLCD
jgi:hypothetical protein